MCSSDLQLLASEGFSAIEDIAFVQLHDLADIEGFDEETAQELQNRAIEFLEKKNAEFEARRKELGVEGGVGEIEGLTPAMLVALGENGIKTVEDVAGCATDDLLGYSEGRDKPRVPGALEGFDLSADEANAIIMKARVAAGWISEEDLAAPQEEPSEEEQTEA